MDHKHALLSGLILASGIWSVVATAQDWAPSRQVRIVVPVIGGTNELVARLVAPKLQETFGQAFIVENKAGAGGNIGVDFVAKSPPDGHTLAIGFNGPIAINVTLFDKLPYDPLKDLAPITLAVRTPQFLVVHADFPAKTPAELVALAKAKPGGLSYASIAVGSASHLTMEMLKAAAGVNIVHVPYKGPAPAVTDLLAGTIPMSFMVPGNVLAHARAGKLRLVASTGRTRFAGTPNVPTMIESGFAEFDAEAWIGFLAPGATPRPVIDRYHREITRILQLPEVRDKLTAVEFEMVGSTPEQFRDWIAKEIPRWAAVIKATGAKAN